jgi:hypothetical protein
VIQDNPEDIKQQAQKIFDEWPDDSAVEDSEFFFVGGSTQVSTPAKKSEMNSQLIGVKTVKDLKAATATYDKPTEASKSFEVVDDLATFARDSVRITDPNQYEELFFSIKRKVYRDFDFFRIISEHMGDIPLTERDMVIVEADQHIIDFLKTGVDDYFAVSSIAYLYALDNMGIDTVRFVGLDDCPICNAYSGLLYNVRSLLQLFTDGQSLTHPFCECEWVPVIFRDRYHGPLQGVLNKSLEIDGMQVVDAPVELLSSIKQELTGIRNVSSVKFLNIYDYLLNESSVSGDSTDVLVVLDLDTLIVHNSYVGIYGPDDFIRLFKQTQSAPPVRDPKSLEGMPIYFIGGRSVYLYEGHYWDSVTGERATTRLKND